MVTDKVLSFDALRLGELFRSGEISPVEVVRMTLDRIDSLNPVLNAFLDVFHDSAMAAARAAEANFSAGIILGPLQGVPVAIKDVIDVAGSTTTAASLVLSSDPPATRDAEVVRRLRAGGAVLVGKTNLSEFAAADRDSNSPFLEVQNPRRLGHQAGSSSNGSAAAVAAGMAYIALGTDTGGSVRHPASVCGVVGLKPTFGRIPLAGVIPYSTHLDHVGILARSSLDVATALEVMSSGADVAGQWAAGPSGEMEGVRGRRVGIPVTPTYRYGVPSVLKALDRAHSLLAELGAHLVEVELPDPESLYEILEVLVLAEGAAFHERYLDRAHLYGRNLRRRIAAGRRVSALDYVRARQAQAELRRDWERLFRRIDLLALPANGAGAPRIDASHVVIHGRSEHFRRVNSRFNRAANLTGFPAVTIPIGETEEGLPVGVQLVAGLGGEADLLTACNSLESVLPCASMWGIDVQGPRDAPPKKG